MTIKSTLLTISILVILASCKTVPVEHKGSGLAKTVIVIGLDGFSVGGFQTAKHPNLDRLLQAGVYDVTHFFLITDHGGVENSHGRDESGGNACSLGRNLSRY